MWLELVIELWQYAEEKDIIMVTEASPEYSWFELKLAHSYQSDKQKIQKQYSWTHCLHPCFTKQFTELQ